MHVELPLVSFLCAILVLVPLPWHWRAGTVPTISITLWLLITNLINGINSIIWANNVLKVAPVWCDISTKILMGSNVALPASIFCLCVHLERLSSLRQARSTLSEKRRRQLFDGLICFVLPMIYMALHYIVQGHRFDIIEDFGCRPNVYVSIPSTFLIWVPPLFFSAGSFVFSGLALRHFWQRRVTFARHLQNSNAALTPSRYFRLMCMALVQMFWGITVTAFDMWFTMKRGLRPWTGWADVHFNFSFISAFPTIFIPPKELLYTYLLWWTIPVSSIIFFAFFSFGQDAMKEYRECGLWIRRKIFRRPDPSAKMNKMNGLGSLPSYHHHLDDLKSPRTPTSGSKFMDSDFESSIRSPPPTYLNTPSTGFVPLSDRFTLHEPYSPSSDITPTYYASSIAETSDHKMSHVDDGLSTESLTPYRYSFGSQQRDHRSS